MIMLRLTFCATLLIALSGCSSLESGAYKDQRFAVKGDVKLDGQPLETGTISFIGLSEGQRLSGGPIVNGKYDITVDQGPNGGKYKIEIRSMKSTGKKIKDSDTGQMIDVMEEALPPRYHSKSILTATIGEQNVWDFDLVSK